MVFVETTMRKVESFIEIIQVSAQGSVALSHDSKGEEEGRRPKKKENTASFLCSIFIEEIWLRLIR